MTTGREHRAFLVAAACVVLTGFCGSAAAAVRLELKLDKGKTYYERSLIEQKITQEMMGQQQVINMTIGIGQKLDVLDVDGQGNMRIRYTYVWSRYKQVDPMTTVEYDSSQQTPPPAGAEGFAALIGQTSTMTISPKGKVLDVSGIEELAEAVRKKMPPETDLSQGMNPLSSFLDKQAVQDMTENSLAVYPDKPVEQGDSWTAKRIIRQGMPMVAESKWTLQKRQAGVATIDAATSLKVDPNGPPLDMQGMKMKIDLSGPQEGTIQMDEATGQIRSHRGRQNLKGQVKIGASAEGPFDMMTIPMAIEVAFTAETSDKMWETKPQ